ncbi:MAG: methyl-accepting chemotaxis protein [Pseudomonas oryzihabitans]
MNLRSLSIRDRNALSFGLLAVLVAGLGFMGLFQLSRLDDRRMELVSDQIPSIVEADNLALLLARTRLEGLRLLALPDPAAMETTKKKLETIKTAVEAGFDNYAKLMSTEREKEALDTLREVHSAYARHLVTMTELIEQNRFDEARKLVAGDMAPLASKMNQRTEALREFNQEDVGVISENAVASYRVTRVIAWTSVLLALTLTILLAWRLTRSIALPISQAVVAARAIASGDLTQELDARGNDEAAQLLRAMQLMQVNLRDTLSHISASSAQLSSSAEEMSAVMQDNATALQKQSAEIESAATAVTEMSQAVDEVAGNATATSTESQQAAKMATQGRQQLGETLGAIETLLGSVVGASDQARRLSEQTRDISKVLDVIRSVAEQTNLLALNAAIEAARAGDAGRGFAVVADEVRALAHRTSESTREIEGMIGSIQQGTGQTVEAMLVSASQAQVTRDQALAANSALNAIAQSVSGIEERNMVIASAAEEQAQVAREVDLNLVRISELSTQTATGSEQTLAASRQLSDLALQLNAQIRKFHL